LVNSAPPPITGFDDPANWTRYVGNPILEGDVAEWDEFWIQPDSVIDLGTGTIYMYYCGDDGGVPSQIGLATSSDGYTWSKYGSNPIFLGVGGGAWDSDAVTHMTVIKEGAGDWKAWYGGRQAPIGGLFPWDIGYATSVDGINWSRYGAAPVITKGGGGAWDSGFVIPSHAFKEGATYYLYYWGGIDNDQSNWAIGLATSSDGINWTKDAGNPIFIGDVGEWDDGVLEGFLVKLSGTYYMFYQGNTVDMQNSAIGVATSNDKVTWVRSANNPFPRGGAGSWDSAWGEAPKLINFGGDWLMYYMSCDDVNNPKKIGVMTFTP